MVITSRTRNAVARSGRVGSNPTVSAITGTAPYSGAVSVIVEIVGGMRTREGATVVRQPGELSNRERVKRPVE